MKLDEGLYRTAGTLVGLSIANEGPCIPLCRELFSMMAGLEANSRTLDPSLVTDEEYRQNLLNVGLYMCNWCDFYVASALQSFVCFFHCCIISHGSGD